MNISAFALAALPITTPLTNAIQTAITGLAGMAQVNLEAQFQYGSGGTTCSAVVQTSFDGGTTWRDVARFDFTTASAVKHCNLNGELSKPITIYAALAAEGVNDAVLGDQLRCSVTSTGTYANPTMLSVRASPR